MYNEFGSLRGCLRLLLSSSSSRTMGPMPVGVRCLLYHFFPLMSVLCYMAQLLQIRSAPFFDVICPLSMWPASFIFPIHHAKHQRFDIPLVSHSAYMTKHAKFALDNFLHKVLLHLYSPIYFFVVNSLGPSNS